MLDTTVIITNFNNEKYIGRAIRSCLKQTLPRDNFEVLVVDDASTDESRAVIDSFGDKVRAICLDENGGVAHASNIGIINAMGRYIIRVDADDYISPLTLQFLTELMEQNPDFGFVYTDHLKVDENERVIERTNVTTLPLLLRHGAGVMFRKSYLEAIGLYNKQLKNAEDHDLIQRYIKNWDGYHLPLPLYRYRQHPTQMTADTEERKRWEKIADETR